MDAQTTRWLDRLDRTRRPIYLALVDALEAAIRDGELHAGDRLPPQRSVAEQLGVDFTTVTRAYTAARERGLVEGTVGRGTFVRARTQDDEAGLVDLTMNLPPPPEGLSLARLLQEGTTAVLQRTDAASLMAYHPGAGTLGQRTAGAAWMAPAMGHVPPERVLVSAGAQVALAAILSAVCRPGEAVVVEPLSYPGVKAVAAQLGLRLLPCPVDADGILPDDLERLCAEQTPAALYLIPTLQNPTAVTMSDARRREVARVATTGGLWILEDDPYSRLFDAPLPAVAAFAPDRAFYVSTLAKCLTPGLRLAYVAAPARMVGAVEHGLRALSLMPAPLMTAVVTSWIREGTAETLLGAVRSEVRARRRLAGAVLATGQGADESLHVWLPLAQAWSPERVRQAAQARGLALVTADSFAMGEAHPNGLRISLGGPGKRSVLEGALRGVARLLDEAPTGPRLVV
jgi:DNA-binding transcriptional MocR family regulator